jgi:hypothetical protein
LVSHAPSVPHPHYHHAAHFLSTPLHVGPHRSHHRPPHRLPLLERFAPLVSFAPSHHCRCPARAGSRDLVGRPSRRPKKLGVLTFSPDRRHWLITGYAVCCTVRAHREPAPCSCAPHTHCGHRFRGPAQWPVGEWAGVGRGHRESWAVWLDSSHDAGLIFHSFFNSRMI